MQRILLRAAICAAFATSLSGCFVRPMTQLEKMPPCTLLGSGPPELATIVVRRSDGKPPNFDIQLEYDGLTRRCHYMAPDAAAEDSICGNEVFATVSETVACDANDTCEPSGRFAEYVSVLAKPKRITLSLSSGNGSSVTRMFRPAYKAVYSNGPKCDPPSWRWEEEWLVAEER